MKFYEKLNEYISALNCTAKDIARISGISAATLSRYRSGERAPETGSEVFSKLCSAIAEAAGEHGITDITEKALQTPFFPAKTLKRLIKTGFAAISARLQPLLTLTLPSFAGIPITTLQPFFALKTARADRPNPKNLQTTPHSIFPA